MHLQMQHEYHGLWQKINARLGAFASCAHPASSLVQAWAANDGVAPELVAVDAVSITVWPNPTVAAASVTVARSADSAVTVLGALGRVVRVSTAPAGGSVVVLVAGWPAGVFSVRGETPTDEVAVRRLVVT